MMWNGIDGATGRSDSGSSSWSSSWSIDDGMARQSILQCLGFGQQRRGTSFVASGVLGFRLGHQSLNGYGRHG
jgi:hypothetical protein